MYRLFQTLALLSVALTSNLWAVADRDRDGNWWRDQAYAMKLAYIVGVMDGTHSVSGLERARMSPDNFVAHKANIDALIGKATAGQIVEGLDRLYADFRNRNIWVNRAFWTVTMAINGMPDDVLHEHLERARRDAASRTSR